MNPLYQSVQRPKVPHSSHPAGGERKLSMNMGMAVPVFCKETLPGDIFKASTELLIKFAPMKAPVMHRIRAYLDYFYVPNYQICKPFDKFINPRLNTPSDPVVLPEIRPYDMNSLGAVGEGTLADYLDLPVDQTAYWQSATAEPISVLPFRAYQHIYNNFFRDQTLQPIEGVDPGDTDLYLMADVDKQGDVANDATSDDLVQLTNMLSLRYSAWKKDYFTSALPTPQAGPDVEIPFTPGRIVSDGTPMSFTGQDSEFTPVSGASFAYARVDVDQEDNELAYVSATNDTATTAPQNRLVYNSGLEITNEAGGISVPALRQLFSLQHFQELQGRGGSRYSEVNYNFFDVKIPDLYVERPVFLGGMYSDVSVGEVLQTSQTTTGDTGSAQGYRAGVASVYGRSKTFRYRCLMHGFIIGILRVLPEATYMQGVERMWSRKSIFDYAWPQFANIGEQEIYNREIFVDGTADDAKVFGFAPRYAEYKDSCSHVNGEFRSSLRYWHFGRYFENRPQLNEDFIKADQISTDPFNVTSDDTDKLYVHLYTKATSKRPLPYWGTPGLYRL